LKVSHRYKVRVAQKVKVDWAAQMVATVAARAMAPADSIMVTVWSAEAYAPSAITVLNPLEVKAVAPT